MIIKSSLPVLLAGFAAFATQEVLDLGSLDQYNGQLNNPPSLSGSTVWLSGSDSGDYDVSLSDDTQSKLQGVLEGCGDNVDNKCYQDVLHVLKESELQLNNQLDRRHLGHLLSKTFGKGGAGAFLSYVSSLLISLWHVKHSDKEFAQKFLPNVQVNAATVLATATNVVISAEGQPVATITPVIDTTTLQGSQTPSVTAVSTAHGAFATGDLAAVLDANLASRLNEIMHRMTDCTDGRDFDAGKASRRRATGTGYGAAICAVEGVAVMAQPGGTLNDLLLLDPSRLRFGFADAAGDVARAAGVAVGFVQAYAPLLAIPDEVAVQLGNYLFALALNTLIDNLPLGDENRIQSSLVTTTTPTATATTSSTSSGCPDPTSSPLTCGNDDKDNCDAEMPKQPDGDPKCKSGEYAGCKCTAPSDICIEVASDEEQQALQLISGLLGHGTFQPPQPTGPTAKCDMKNLSNIPGNVFGGAKNNVYHHFCDKWASAAGTELKMTVDASGNNKAPEGQLLLRPRTPPPNPSLYTHYNFDLSFKPSDGSKKCVKKCKDAFYQISSACSNTGAMEQLMQKSGSLDVDCGVFDYNITPTTPLALQERHCYGANDFGSHDDIHSDQISFISGFACAGTAIKTIKRGDASTNIAYAAYDNRQPVQFNVYWKNGCVLDSPSGDEVYPANPLALKDPGYAYCQDLFIDNYQKCDNTGVGGSIQAGCLVYDLKAKHD